MKPNLKALAVLAVPALALAFTAALRAQDYHGTGAQSYPYQTPGVQSSYGQPQGYWSRYYGTPSQVQPYGQMRGSQAQAYDQQYQQQQYQRPGQYTSSEYQEYAGQANQGTGQAGTGREQQIRGRVVRTRQMEVPNSDTEVLVGLVETNQGRVVVDFGPCDELRENGCQIRRDQQVSAWGHFARAGNARVFVADNLRVDGKNVDVDRSWTITTQQLRNEANMLGSSMGSGQYQQSQGGSSRQWANQGQRDGYDQQGSGRQQGYTQQGGQGGYSPQANRAGYTQQGGPAGEHQRDLQGSYSQQRGQGGYDQGSQSGSSQRVSGRVMRTQRIELPGMQGEILACQMRNEQGQQVICILGPEDDLQGVQVSQGDNLTVRGFPTWVNGWQVILARSVNANGQTAQVPVQRMQSQRISGEVTRTRWIQLPGMRHEIQVACLRTEQGRQVVAVLGTEQDMGRHEISRGDEISVRGDLLDVNGQQVLLTQQIRSHGEQTTLNQQQH